MHSSVALCPSPKLAEAAKQGASLGAGTIPPVVIPQARAALGESGVLHSFPFCRLVGMHRRDCSRPLTLYGPQAAHSSPLLPASCDIPLNSAAHVCLAWKVIQGKPGPWGPDPRPGPQRPTSALRKREGSSDPATVCVYSCRSGGALSAALGAWWGACEVHGVSLGSWTILARQPLNGADL